MRCLPQRSKANVSPLCGLLFLLLLRLVPALAAQEDFTYIARLGLYDALGGTEHTATNGTQTSAFFQLTESGYLRGFSARYNGTANVIGGSAWLASVTTGVTTRVGFYDAAAWPAGSGKTGMATYWESVRLQEGKRAGMFDTAQGVLSRIKASWATQTTDALMRELSKSPYLVLDEMDERAHSEWEEYMLFDIFNRRYNDELATVLISNLSAEEISTQFRAKILARINENGGLVTCGWESYRG